MATPPFDFEYLRRLVREHSAVVLEPHKDYLAKLHLEAVAASAGCESIAALVEKLKRQPFGKLHHQTIEALLINETLFFRDQKTFETLKLKVLPTLIEQRKRDREAYLPGNRTLNIWCGACSSGQEPYSIAMLIKEYFPILLTWNLQIIASDFSHKMVTRARQGCYTPLESDRGLPVKLREKYFQRQGDNWQIRAEIRQMVEIRQMNLIHAWTSLPQLDIIFLRNVLIYFDTETKRGILRKVHQQLKVDGYLFLGSSETTIHLDPTFEFVQENNSSFHRFRI
jgi:chemotaxis protein methyltransferase CheR